jgi:outer membrane protein assembly factor BamB
VVVVNTDQGFTQSNVVTAVNPDGSEKWKFVTNDFVDSSPAIGADGTVYVGSADNNLYVVNPDGSQKWKFPTGDDVYSSPAVGSDGTIYVGSLDGNLYAVH